MRKLKGEYQGKTFEQNSNDFVFDCMQESLTFEYSTPMKNPVLRFKDWLIANGWTKMMIQS